MAAIQESTLDFPVDSFRKISGFSLDIGGSVCKVVFRHKEDWEKLQKADSEPKTGKLRLVCLRSEDATEAFQMLKEKCYIPRTVEIPTPTVYTTGIGSNQAATTIPEVLDVKLKNLSEYDCHIDGFIYLSQYLPMDTFTIPLKEDLVKNAYKLANKTSPSEHIPARQPCQKVDFPAMLVMCGSGVATIRIQRNGDFAAPDGTNIVGRFFIGMGSLLTRAKTYDEIIDLASKGNNANIDLYDVDLANRDEKFEGGSTDEVTAKERSNILSHFYKANGKQLDDFKREDLALSLVHMVTQQLAQFVIYSALRSKCYQVFFGGSFFNRELVRDVMTASFINRLIAMKSLTSQLKAEIDFHFLRYGSHLAAVGALVAPLSPDFSEEK